MSAIVSVTSRMPGSRSGSIDRSETATHWLGRGPDASRYIDADSALIVIEQTGTDPLTKASGCEVQDVQARIVGLSPVVNRNTRDTDTESGASFRGDLMSCC